MSVAGLGVGQFAQPHPLAQAWTSLAEQKPLDHAGISVGEFIGWRIWGIQQGILTSYSAHYAWMPGHPARGEISDHGHGGLWAFKDPNRALHKAVSDYGEFVVGSVWMWGEIVEHKDGYRAEYAMIRSIDAAPGERKKRRWWGRKEPRLLDVLRDRYGVTRDAGAQLAAGD